jgi:hypothetical protein
LDVLNEIRASIRATPRWPEQISLGFRHGQRRRGFTRTSRVQAKLLRHIERATIQCELTDAGQTYGVNVSGTRVDASNVKFDIKADDQSEP